MIRLLHLWNSYITTAITASGTSIVLSSVTDIPTAPFHAIIGTGSNEEEVVKVTAVTTATKTLTVVRGQAGTTGVAHGDNALFHHCEIDARMIHLDGLTVTLVGTAGLVAVSLTVTDNIVAASGRGIGFFIDYVMNDTKTGSYGVRTTRINTQILGDVPSVQVADWYMHTIDDKTIGWLQGLSLYWEDYGNVVSELAMIDLGKASVHATLGRNAYMRFREHGTIQVGSTVFLLEGLGSAEDFLTFDSPAAAENAGEILESGSHSETADYRIKCRLLGNGDIDRYLYLFPI